MESLVFDSLPGNGGGLPLTFCGSWLQRGGVTTEKALHPAATHLASTVVVAQAGPCVKMVGGGGLLVLCYKGL